MNDCISDLIDALPGRVNDDGVLRRIGRFCSTRILLEAGEQAFHLRVDRGRLDPVLHGPRPLRAWTFALRAPGEVWLRFWEPVPAPGYSDIFALARYGHLRIEGDVGPLLENLRYVKAVLALHEKVLPPSLHCETPNPNIDFASSPFFVNTECKPWSAGECRSTQRMR